jgi:hypothetical protein
MVLDAPTGKWLSTDWFPTRTNAALKNMTPIQIHDVHVYIEIFFNIGVRPRPPDGFKVCVPINCPNPWPQVLDPVYNAVGNYEDAAKFLGNLYCRVGIRRNDAWISSPLPWPGLKHKPRVYVPFHNITGARRGGIGLDPEIR